MFNYSLGMQAWSRTLEFSSMAYKDVVYNAMYIYGTPVQPMLGDTGIEINDIVPLRLYPCMKFTCPGTIVKLMFVASVVPNGTEAVWPSFSLWKRCDLGYCRGDSMDRPGWIEVKKLSNYTLSHQHPRLIHRNGTVGVYEMMFTGNSSFSNGSFLGIDRPAFDSPAFAERRPVTVLHQNGGGKCDAVSILSQNENFIAPGSKHRYVYGYQQSSLAPILPYIAIETRQKAGQIFNNLIN